MGVLKDDGNNGDDDDASSLSYLSGVPKFCEKRCERNAGLIDEDGGIDRPGKKFAAGCYFLCVSRLVGVGRSVDAGLYSR